MAPHAHGERGRQPAAQYVGVSGDLLWALSGWRGEVHPATLEGETKPEWYLRQMLGTANFRAGPVLAFLSGNLCYQIEHHLFPNLPSNRYAQIAARVQAVCATYDLPYTTGPLARQYLLSLRTIFMLALPDRFLGPTLAERDTHRCGGGLVTGAQPGFTSWSATRSDDTAATSRMAS